MLMSFKLHIFYPVPQLERSADSNFGPGQAGNEKLSSSSSPPQLWAEPWIPLST